MFALPDHSPCCCMTESCQLWPYHLGSTPVLAWGSFWPVEAAVGSQGQEGENWVFLSCSLPAELRVIGGSLTAFSMVKSPSLLSSPEVYGF